MCTAPSIFFFKKKQIRLVLIGSQEKVSVVHYSNEQVTTAVPGQSEEREIGGVLSFNLTLHYHRVLTTRVFLEQRVKK